MIRWLEGLLEEMRKEQRGWQQTVRHEDGWLLWRCVYRVGLTSCTGRLAHHVSVCAVHWWWGAWMCLWL